MGLPLGYNTIVVAVGLALLGASAGAVGTFALSAKRALVVDALGHATLPGVALAFLLAEAVGLEQRSIVTLLCGAGCSALVALWWLERLLAHTRTTADAATGAVLSSFFGLGIVLLGIAQRSSGQESGGLDRLIFGQAAALLRGDAIAMAVLAAICLVLLRVFFRPLLWSGFDAQVAQTSGMSPRAAQVVLFTMLFLITLAGLPTVGMLLVIGLLVLPAAAARPWVLRFPAWIALSASIGAGAALLGALLSWRFERVPTGPMIVLVLGAALVFGRLLAPRDGLFASLFARHKLRRALEL